MSKISISFSISISISFLISISISISIFDFDFDFDSEFTVSTCLDYDGLPRGGRNSPWGERLPRGGSVMTSRIGSQGLRWLPYVRSAGRLFRESGGFTAIFELECSNFLV
jgi:hypothetical protein